MQRHHNSETSTVKFHTYVPLRQNVNKIQKQQTIFFSVCSTQTKRNPNNQTARDSCVTSIHPVPKSCSWPIRAGQFRRHTWQPEFYSIIIFPFRNPPWTDPTKRLNIFRNQTCRAPHRNIGISLPNRWAKSPSPIWPALATFSANVCRRPVSIWWVMRPVCRHHPQTMTRTTSTPVDWGYVFCCLRPAMTMLLICVHTDTHTPSISRYDDIIWHSKCRCEHSECSINVVSTFANRFHVPNIHRPTPYSVSIWSWRKTRICFANGWRTPARQTPNRRPIAISAWTTGAKSSCKHSLEPNHDILTSSSSISKTKTPTIESPSHLYDFTNN